MVLSLRNRGIHRVCRAHPAAGRCCALLRLIPAVVVRIGDNVDLIQALPIIPVGISLGQLRH